jgi:putative addiction module component (TIGR02574 family)
MMEYQSILDAARQLPESDRIRLIDELSTTVPDEDEAALTEEWSQEIARRIAELESGKATTIPWSQVRDEALARIGHGKTG